MRLSSIFKSAIISTLMISSALQAKPVYVATTAIVEHPALDAVRDGVKQVLNENESVTQQCQSLEHTWYLYLTNNTNY